jgi:hypothetical protein
MFQFQTMNTKRPRDDDSDSDEDRYFKVRNRSRPGNSTRLTGNLENTPVLDGAV